MYIGDLRIDGHTDCAHRPLTFYSVTQHDDQWQGEAVGAQLHAVPAALGTE